MYLLSCHLQKGCRRMFHNQSLKNLNRQYYYCLLILFSSTIFRKYQRLSDRQYYKLLAMYKKRKHQPCYRVSLPRPRSPLRWMWIETWILFQPVKNFAMSRSLSADPEWFVASALSFPLSEG